MKTFPLYSASQTRELDALCIADEKISGYCLMQRAGQAAFNVIIKRWPEIKSMTVVCGTGNNGGDGYVIAKLAVEHGMSVHVIQLGEFENQTGDAVLARQALEKISSIAEPFKTHQQFKSDLIVDAIFGTGLTREVGGDWAKAIAAINRLPCPVVAIDIPSGLNADTGSILGCAVNADMTVTFIARKQGLYTGDGKQLSGDIQFESLNVSHCVTQKISPVSYCIDVLSGPLLEKRPANSHKKDFGHVLLVGGAPGMRGAIQLAAHAALRSGAGLVTVATHPDHAAYFNMTIPELMVLGVENQTDLFSLMDRADTIVIGPGLGQDQWSNDLFSCALHGDHPLVVDADALNILATQKLKRDNWVLTPHPGEAARLLHTSVSNIQADRYNAAAKIQNNYGGVCVLKGSGTIIRDNEKSVVCPFGNPGMATAGMGDVLAGVLGSVIGQSRRYNLLLEEVVAFAVSLHSLAGDRASIAGGERGLMASDLIPYLRQLINECA